MFNNSNNDIHITICYLENVPKVTYYQIINDVKDVWKNMVESYKWSITFVNRWGKNSMNVTGVNSKGITLEDLRSYIFKYISSKYNTYISKKRSITGYVQTHIDTSSIKNKPKDNETWNNLQMTLQ